MDHTLRLNPNCCYKACPSCQSVRRLAEFQGAHPTDWPERLRGSPRLLAGIRAGWITAPVAAGIRCEECGGFDAVDFAGTWICPECCSARGACCGENEL